MKRLNKLWTILFYFSMLMTASGQGITLKEVGGVLNYRVGNGAYKPVSSSATSGTGVSGPAAWSAITGKPTTVSGYGITDGVNSTTYTTNRTADQNAAKDPNNLNLDATHRFATDAEKTVNKQVSQTLPIGTIYFANSWTSSSFSADFTQTGSAFSVNSFGKIAVSSSSALFTNILKLNNLKLNDENVEISVLFQLGTVDANSFGLSIGMRGLNTWFPVKLYAQASFASGQADIKFWKGETNPSDILATNSNTLTCSTNDIVRLTFTRQGSSFQIRLNNLSAGTSKLLLVQQNLSSSPNFNLINANELAIVAHGNTYSILELSVKSGSIIQPDIVMLGDSKTAGYVAQADAARWPILLGNLLNKKTAVYAGGGDRTAELLQAVDYVTKYVHPKYTILNIGRNDLNSSVSSATWQANYASIVTKLKTAGINVVHLLPIPETGQSDQSALKSYIQTTYSGDTQIDPSVGWSNGTMLGSDGVHPNATGHTFISTTIQGAYSFP